MNMWNIRICEMFICIGIWKTLETLTTFFSSGTKLITFLTFRFFDTRRERDTFYYADCSIWPHHARRISYTQLDSPRFGFQLASSSFKSQLTAFFSKITQNPQPIASGHDVIHIPSLISHLGFLLWHLWLSHPPHTSANTCAQWVPLPVH